MKFDQRHKCIVIPIIRTPTGNRILTVRDKRFKEWTFITGGCRKREVADPIKCALRELDEETRSSFNITGELYKYFKFTTKLRSPEELERDRREGLEVTCTHHVYVFIQTMTTQECESVVRNFNYEKDKTENKRRNKIPIKKAFDENDILSFDTYPEFMQRNVWPFITHTVLCNEEFEKILKDFLI